ncbi:hypothetical protein WA588_000908 [Blastocystis sp. NMH]
MFYTVIGVILVTLVALKAFHKHSLSYGGACSAIVVGSIHILAGWRYAVLLIFFFLTSSKLTKMWSSVKRQREDDFVFGGERNGMQVLSNSFVPTLLCVYVIYARSGLSSTLYGRIPYQESMLILPMVLAYYCECSADTWGSEVGILSTKPYLYFIPSMPVPPGTNGGISALGMCAALCAGLLMSVLYAVMEPSYPLLPFSTCLMVCMVASVMGTFLDSFLGSVFEESWWCSTRRCVIHFEEHACEKCEEARRKGERVSGHSPSKCGLVCGRPVMNGSFVNLLSSSLTSVLIGVFLFVAQSTM